jgi:hypothetical protein
VVRKNGEAADPSLDLFGGEDGADSLGERPPAGGVEAHEEKARVGAGLETTHVGKIEILGNKKSPFVLGGLPDIFIRVSRKKFFGHGMDIVPELPEGDDKLLGQILVELEFHPTAGTAESGKSSPALLAAKAITARTASGVTVGKSATISSAVAHSARLARRVRTVTRVPRITVSPPQMPASRAKCRW